MLSYQHQYHAGNHADVLKHWLLIECINYLSQKPKVFDYIDTHAGAGSYDLSSAEAKKTGECLDGVLKLNWPSLNGLEDYQSLIAEDLDKQRYPGSPAIVNRLLREGDHSWLYELHPQTIQLLKQQCAIKRKTYVMHEDGLQALVRLLPTKSRRAIVLIDPSYEVKTEYLQVVNTVQKAWKKAPQTVFLVWYPIVDKQHIQSMEKAFKESGIKNIQQFEMAIAETKLGTGMNASGMFIVNPPWRLAEQFKLVMPAVSANLANDKVARTHFSQLVAE